FSRDWSADVCSSDLERYGLLTAIDRWVLRRYCRWLAANPRHQQGLAQVNINLSAPSLLDPEFHALLDELLDTPRPAGRQAVPGDHRDGRPRRAGQLRRLDRDRKSTRLNSSHVKISYAVFCLKKKNTL